MADVQEDVTLLAHIQAVDEGASVIFNSLINVAGGLGGTLKATASAAANAFGTLAATAGTMGATVVGVYQQSVGSALSYAEAVEKVAFLTGQSTEKASGYIAAYRHFGFTTDEATMSVTRLTMRLGAYDLNARSAKGASDATKQALAELGLTTKDLISSNGDLNVLMPKIIDHMKNMHDPLERDKLAMQLFGRSFSSIAPLIEAGGAAWLKAESDAKLFGVTLTNQQEQVLIKYKASMETTKEAVLGLTLQIALNVLPYFQKLEDMIKQGISWWEHLSPSIHKTTLEVMKLTAVFGPLIGGGEALHRVVLPLVRNVPLLGSAFQMLLGPIAPILDIIGPLVALFIILNDQMNHGTATGQRVAAVFNELKVVWKDVLGLLDILRDVGMTIFNDLFNRWQGSTKGLGDTVQRFLMLRLGDLEQWLKGATVWIAQHRDAIETWANKIADFAGDLAKFVADTLQPFLDTLGSIKDFIVNDLVPALTQVVWPAADPTVTAAWGWLKDNGKLVGTALRDIAIGFVAYKIAVTGIAAGQAVVAAIQGAQGAIDMLRLSIFAASDAQTAMTGNVVVGSARMAGAWIAAAARGTAAFLAMSARAVVGAAEASAAWVASSAVAVASAIRAAAGWVIANTAMLAVKAATIAWTVVQWLLNVALTANPIGLVIAAIALLIVGIVWAYKNVGWFRDGVNQTWGILKAWGTWIATTLWPIIMNVFNWLKTNVPAILGGVGSAFSALGTTVHNAWSGIAGSIKSFLNSIIANINTFIGGINRMGSAIQAIPGVPHFGTIPPIPRLASGGVFPSGMPTLAMIGEGKETEVVSTLSQAMRAGMMAMQGAGGAGFGNITVEYHVDGRLIEKRTSRITGKRMRLQGAGIGSGA